MLISKSLQTQVTRGAGSRADGSCPRCYRYSQWHHAVCCGCVAVWPLHSYFCSIWFWSSLHMELIWNPSRWSECWRSAWKKTQILKASSLQICKSCLHDHTILLYSKYLCSPATVASMYVSYRTVVKYGEWYNNMVFKVICDAQGSTFIFLSPTWTLRFSVSAQ